ncbi:aldose epimerase [Aquimarina sp. Aq78]|uniref:aldose epimerase family protein n=1 Tax=Aquimarina sp. Aq78 TaxID=1191889 RepID=UPI000D0E9819|nr:aldose epimerase [Aquimarina sp. Aq78]
MPDKTRLYSPDKKTIATIDHGELISYQVDSIEVMHQKGDAGWGNTEIEMFPTIGSTKENQFSVQTPKGDAKLDQHGILRVMDYLPVRIEKSSASFHKKYAANTQLSNHKYPNKSSQQWLNWPYDFEFIKTFELSNEALKIIFEIKSEKDMPLMLGFHPAFKIYSQNIIMKTAGQNISLDAILEAGASAFLLKDCREISFTNNGSLAVNLKTNGFKHIMLWSEVTNMVCIEPITFYPSSVPVHELHTGFDYSSGYEKFEVIISPSYD